LSSSEGEAKRDVDPRLTITGTVGAAIIFLVASSRETPLQTSPSDHLNPSKLNQSIARDKKIRRATPPLSRLLAKIMSELPQPDIVLADEYCIALERQMLRLIASAKCPTDSLSFDAFQSDAFAVAR